MVTGPMGLRWDRRLFEFGALETYSLPSRDRLDAWVSSNIHVKGRPEWVLVKVYTHSAAEDTRDVFFSDAMAQVYHRLVDEYGSGRFRLHFVTAREMYNVVMAAVDDKHGDPQDYLDYILPPPPYTLAWASGRFLVRSGDGWLTLRRPEPDPGTVLLASGPVRKLEGPVSALRVERDLVTVAASAPVRAWMSCRPEEVACKGEGELCEALLVPTDGLAEISFPPDPACPD